ncbi:lipase 1-like isoform X2 [Harmonia axyridis]|nr:lipase 1-like isoform X2 [Harmonia axyridis]
MFELCTEDGYYVTLFRIRTKNVKNPIKALPVLIVHGFTASVAESVMEKHQLGYYLADFGLDVWIANCRGTTYSRGHKTYKENSEKYWDYSFHEIGIYDVPIFIDFILEQTQQKKLYYIGVSQGCIALSILLSTRLEYNDKIEVACFLCPAMKYKDTKLSLMKVFFYCVPPALQWFADNLHIPLQGDILCYLTRVIGLEASKYSIGRSIFSLLWSYIGGYQIGESSKDLKPELLCRTSPNTVSLKQLVHFSQIVRGCRFTMYDYGPEQNMKLYKKKVPPSYDISKVSVPIGLFYSKNDTCYGVKDMDDLSKELGNCVYKFIVEDDKFNHFDFVYHTNVRDMLYKHVLDFMKKYIPHRL